MMTCSTSTRSLFLYSLLIFENNIQTRYGNVYALNKFYYPDVTEDTKYIQNHSPTKKCTAHKVPQVRYPSLLRTRTLHTRAERDRRALRRREAAVVMSSHRALPPSLVFWAAGGRLDLGHAVTLCLLPDLDQGGGNVVSVLHGGGLQRILLRKSLKQ